ncbi:hypothetical protein [Snodgrassella alvi]|jgi:hypothetical protein|uniref:Uncharacterized protein n=1 Tax=Snodgrassella alvi TaxID=1196083 RepID=A0A855FR49_9NEIS|nr:hypothetical protein [Snodgrassella alvi]PIT11658.1 hypothetical protein BGI30_04040 [Snodgrassella alvi]PIT55302.1 hypothetical protein BHC59_11110 [Snodgrassella alvi]PIT62560.1 hypothetical protein BHC57_01110 [Snodgrassella alvi]
MSNENDTNPKPVGFWDEMAQIVSEFNLNQSPTQTKPQPEKRLANNELVDIAYEAIYQLYHTKYDIYLKKMANELVKAIVSGGHYEQQTVGQILSHLPPAAKKMVTEYVQSNAN